MDDILVYLKRTGESIEVEFYPPHEKSTNKDKLYWIQIMYNHGQTWSHVVRASKKVKAIRIAKKLFMTKPGVVNVVIEKVKTRKYEVKGVLS